MRNSLGEKSPTVRLQISRPASQSALTSRDTFRISEPISPWARWERPRSWSTGGATVMCPSFYTRGGCARGRAGPARSRGLQLRSFDVVPLPYRVFDVVVRRGVAAPEADVARD